MRLRRVENTSKHIPGYMSTCYLDEKLRIQGRSETYNYGKISIIGNFKNGEMCGIHMTTTGKEHVTIMHYKNRLLFGQRKWYLDIKIAERYGFKKLL